MNADDCGIVGIHRSSLTTAARDARDNDDTSADVKFNFYLVNCSLQIDVRTDLYE